MLVERRKGSNRDDDLYGTFAKRAKAAVVSSVCDSKKLEHQRPDAGTKAGPPASVLATLGSVAKMQQQIAEDKSKLRLFVINAKKREDASAWEHEYYKAALDDRCGPDQRYVLKGELGRGVFATVCRCVDSLSPQDELAVKFIRSNQMAKKAAESELALLRRLKTQAFADEDGWNCILPLAGCEHFVHSNHVAIVFPLMKCDLRAAIARYGQGRGLPLVPTVRNFAKNLFMALRFLANVDVIHGDVKPDNLLLSPDKMSIKLCDFGNAMDMIDRIHTDYLQPRYYRAPEVIIGQSYNPQIDMWSAAATLFEAATDSLLFSGSTNNEMIHDMLNTVGAFPPTLTECGGYVEKHFNKDGNFVFNNTRDAGKHLKVVSMAYFAKPSRPILQLLRNSLAQAPQGMNEADHTVIVHQFNNLLVRCLLPDPDDRLAPEDALLHKLFSPFAELVGRSR